ncbi:hypothetical protein GN958_ATG11834 [Phytophthora infestans]|uniref:Secreted RxLR effector peptide protein n=1 Tax=Phytophthora infestans TaxID=4787 RepID=A0A8S9UHD9_PHYIN|nr:hypothetical protein GN958_ATG11834 [Phytophthora infestans]
MFKLEDGIEKALASSNLKTMETYVKELRTKNRKSTTSVLGILTNHYGDDAVASALVTAPHNTIMKDMEDTIWRLRNTQLSAWLSSDKSVDDVFNLLKLRQDGYLALASPKLEVLDDYIKLIIRSKSSQETLRDVLTRGFGERRLARLLVRAKQDDRTKELATALQNAILNKWVTDKLQPVNVLQRLRLDRGVTKAMTDLNRDTLTRYISLFKTHNPSSKTSFIGTLSAHYGDDAVAKALVTASSDASTKEGAIQLRSEQLTDWLNNEKTVDEVFKLLKLRDDGEVGLISHKLEALKDYIKLFNRERTGDETLLKTLTTGFGGESGFSNILLAAKADRRTNTVAMSLQSELLHQWLKSGLQPGSVLKKLKLDRGITEALSDGNIHTLTAYISLYSTQNPSNAVSLIKILSAHYGDDVAKALAMDDFATTELASNLLTQQLQLWLKSVGDVFAILNVGHLDFLSMKSQKLQILDSYLKMYNAKNPLDAKSMFAVVRKGFGGDAGLARVIGKALVTSQNEPKMALKYQNELFNQWFNRNIEPKNVYVEVLKIKKRSADFTAKGVAKRCKNYYKKRVGEVITFNNPRRS